MDYWGGCRTLDEFNEFHLIPGEHRNKTFKATAYNGEIFAVKEYMLTGPMDACAREAALLVRLQHQHVVRVVSVFIDSKCTCLYMQMPFYQEGSMDVWIKDKGALAMTDLREVFLSRFGASHTINPGELTAL